MVNMLELDRAMTFIEDHPEKHNQRSWTCETGACLAGHAALMNGWRATDLNGSVLPEDSLVTNEELTVANVEWRERYGSAADDIIRGKIWEEWDQALRALGARGVSPLAAEILDLTHTEANILFDEDNKTENMRKMVKALGNGEDLTKAFVLTDNGGYVPVDSPEESA